MRACVGTSGKGGAHGSALESSPGRGTLRACNSHAPFLQHFSKSHLWISHLVSYPILSPPGSCYRRADIEAKRQSPHQLYPEGLENSDYRASCWTELCSKTGTFPPSNRLQLPLPTCKEQRPRKALATCSQIICGKNAQSCQGFAKVCPGQCTYSF